MDGGLAILWAWNSFDDFAFLGIVCPSPAWLHRFLSLQILHGEKEKRSFVLGLYPLFFSFHRGRSFRVRQSEALEWLLRHVGLSFWGAPIPRRGCLFSSPGGWLDSWLGGGEMKSCLSSLKKTWGFYLGIGACVLFCFGVAGTYLGKTKEEEKIDIFLVADRLDYDSWNQKLAACKPAYLKELNYRFLPSSEQQFPSVLGTYGAVEADLFFFPSFILETVNCASLMLPFSEEQGKNAFGADASFYSEGGATYGVKISPQGFSGEGDFYACFRSTSLHLGGLQGSERNGDIEVVRAFL